MRMRALALLGALATAVVASGPVSLEAQAPAQTTTGGTVSGTFTVAGKAAQIAHVYASIGPGFFDKTKQDITLTVADIALTPKQLTDEFALVELADAGKAHGIVFAIDADKQIISCQLHDQAFHMVASVVSTNIKLDATTFTKTRIAGKAYTVKPDTFGPKDVPYAFSITFDTPVKATGK